MPHYTWKRWYYERVFDIVRIKLRWSRWEWSGIYSRKELHNTGVFGFHFLQATPLFARKHRTIGGHIEYYIGTDAESLAKNLTDENAIAKLRGNNIGNTEYILYDLRNSSAGEKTKPQMAAIVYVGFQA